MASESVDLTRRKFMMMSSAAIASPLILNAAGSVAASKTAEARTTETGIAPKGTKIYCIGNGCIGCQVCWTFCPAQAIRFGNCKNEIDQKKCIHCGTCYRECPVSAISETEIGASYYEEKKNTGTKVIDCDLVVLGAGGAGLVSAVKASEEGVKKVIVLEKAKKPGGATYFASGPGVGSIGGIMDGAPSGVSGGPGGQGDAPSGGSSSPGGQGGAPSGMGGGQSGFTSWFTSKVGSENFVNGYRTEKYKDLPDPSIGPGRGGTFTVDKMVEFCQKQGIQILYESPARKFITDAKGKVTAVLADTKDGQLLVNCKACVIASGGFGRNYEKLKKYWPEEYNHKEMFFLCPPGMMGDGIDMAEEIGAYIDQTKWDQEAVIAFFAKRPTHHPYSFSLMELAWNGMFVSINLDGKRWKNESGKGPSICEQPRAVAYAVADNDIAEAAGSEIINKPNANELQALKKWRDDLEYEAAIDEEGASGDHVKKANTLVELALKMKIDPKTFVETIERYNKFCETGKDLDFGKSAELLKPIKNPPFWAIYGVRFSQCSKGLNGIAVNPNYEVLNPKGEAMPGLFAAGDTCTIYGGLQMSARRTSASGDPSEASGGAPVAGGPSMASGMGGGQSGMADAAGGGMSGGQTGTAGGSPSGMGGAPGDASAASVNILSTTPTPCDGSMNALSSGYSTGVHVAEYLKKNS